MLDEWLQYLITPEMNWADVDTPITMTFKMYYTIQDTTDAPAPYDGYDGCNLWFSTDLGSNWNIVPNVLILTSS